MATDEIMGKIGSWAFLIGIAIALVFGIYQAYTVEQYMDGEIMMDEVFFYSETGGAVAWVLAALGAIIGVLTIIGKSTITAKEIPL